MRPRRLKTVDVFTHVPLLGNPVAVLLDAEGLTTEDMQRVARWTNLSETTFLLPASIPGADYRLRIFTPASELPFAGHPTLGSAHAAVEAGRVHPQAGRLVQECAAGLIEIEVRSGGQFSLTMPPARFEPLGEEDTRELTAILGPGVDIEVPATLVDVGARWIVTGVQDPATLLAMRPDFTRSAALERKLRATGISAFAVREEDMGIEVRSFAPSSGVNEDPVCGSGNGAVASYRQLHHLLSGATTYQARQGQCVGRDGRLSVEITASGEVRIGGACVTCVDGVLTGP